MFRGPSVAPLLWFPGRRCESPRVTSSTLCWFCCFSPAQCFLPCLWAFSDSLLFLRPSSRFLVQGLVDKNVCVAVKSRRVFSLFFWFLVFWLFSFFLVQLIKQMYGWESQRGLARQSSTSGSQLRWSSWFYFLFYFFRSNVVDKKRRKKRSSGREF